MEDYFGGKKLYGDDFTREKIKTWYEDEKEGYADLGTKNNSSYQYEYHEMDKYYFFNQLPKTILFKNVLGIGSAYGHEFKPIINKIENLFIIEPSDKLISTNIDGLIPKYKKPNIDGKLDFNDNYFDLIICFSVLHHIPNVSYILSEAHRCLKPGGYLLIREPINSMGDWTTLRPGLTKRERGIPLVVFRKSLRTLDFKVIYEGFGFCMTHFFQRSIGKLLKKPLHSYKTYIKIDNFLSKLFSKNIVYHPVNKWQRIGPTCVYYILQKTID